MMHLLLDSSTGSKVGFESMEKSKGVQNLRYTRYSVVIVHTNSAVRFLAC